MIGTLQDYLKDMEKGVFDYTDNGKCSNCGGCCADLLPVSDKEIKHIKLYLKSHDVKEQKHVLPTMERVIDMTCPFRDERNRKCLIYCVRPAICRDFKCDMPKKKIELNKALYHGKYQAISMRETFFP